MSFLVSNLVPSPLFNLKLWLLISLFCYPICLILCIFLRSITWHQMLLFVFKKELWRISLTNLRQKILNKSRDVGHLGCRNGHRLQYSRNFNLDPKITVSHLCHNTLQGCLYSPQGYHGGTDTSIHLISPCHRHMAALLCPLQHHYSWVISWQFGPTLAVPCLKIQNHREIYRQEDKIFTHFSSFLVSRVITVLWLIYHHAYLYNAILWQGHTNKLLDGQAEWFLNITLNFVCWCIKHTCITCIFTYEIILIFPIYMLPA